MESVDVFYWLPHCTTCQRAENFLKEHGITINRYVNLKTDKVERKTLEQLAEKLGGVDKLFSKRAIKYRTMGLNTRELSTDEMLDLMQQEYTFVKRPVVVTASGRALAGFTKKQFESLVS
jgi:arsenate reductase (glutaredoxin)